MIRLLQKELLEHAYIISFNKDYQNYEIDEDSNAYSISW